MVPLIRPVAAIDAEPGRQAAGGVGQRVAVGVGGAGIEADDVTLGVGLVGQSWSKVGFWLVLVTVQLKVSLSSTARSSRTVTVDRVGAAAGGIEG